MEWYNFALITAVLAAIAILIQKKTLLKEHAMEFAANIALFGMIISIPFFFRIDYSQLQAIHFIILIPMAVISTFAFLLATKSIRHMQISKSLPLLALGPGVTTLIAFIILGETVTALQMGGIALLMTGAYVLETRKHGNMFTPFKILKKSKYAHYIFLALLLYGITATMGRLLMGKLGMQPEAFIAFSYVLIAVNFFIMLTVFHDGFKGMKRGIKRVGPWLFIYSLVIVMASYTQANAFKLAQAGLVASLKITYVLFATIIGGELFHDKDRLKRVIASAIIVAGAIVISI